MQLQAAADCEIVFPRIWPVASASGSLPFPQSTTHSGKHLANRKGLVFLASLFLSLPFPTASLCILPSPTHHRHRLYHQPQLTNTSIDRFDSSSRLSFDFSRRPSRIAPLIRIALSALLSSSSFCLHPFPPLPTHNRHHVQRSLVCPHPLLSHGDRIDGCSWQLGRVPSLSSSCSRLCAPLRIASARAFAPLQIAISCLHTRSIRLTFFFFTHLAPSTRLVSSSCSIRRSAGHRHSRPRHLVVSIPA